MRNVHRWLAVAAVLFALWIGFTGTWVQLIDLRTLFAHVPASDPDLRAIREGRDGPRNFQVIVDSDYTANALPADFDFDAALSTTLQSARASTNGAPLSFVELRVADGKPVAQMSSQGKLLRFDALSGVVLAGPDTAEAVSLPPGSRPSLRNTLKNLHRMTTFGDWATPFFTFIALLMCTMTLTGLVMYFRLLAARRRVRRPGLFWSAGGAWRTLHRALAISCSLFLVIVVLSGTFLSIGSIGVAWNRMTHPGRPGLTVDVSSPLTDAELPGMLHTTLRAYRADNPAMPIKVVRLRYFAGVPQGVIVAGPPEDTRQTSYNAATGGIASLSGPTYPVTGQTFGWQADQIAKQIHRGDYIGLSGRWMSLFTGLSLLFLTVSGSWMYLDMWRRRRVSGRGGFFWP